MSGTDKKIRILCVEDDPQLRTFLLAQLKARDFLAQAVSDGAATRNWSRLRRWMKEPMIT